ncbi:MAG TPA: fused MFS/spermidine synthase, partial [Ktedonobacterales bacterium]|nr:fused MFS/spermidine synthase [Ktedonobacterales bacterium]
QQPGRSGGRLPLMALVFVGGMVSLGLEMCGPRLMAPYFGTSLFIWANQIGFTLIYLSLGYAIGGRVADRYPNPRLLCALVVIAAVFTGIIPFISAPILNWALLGIAQVNAGVFIGSLVSVNLLFLVPTTLLGMVSPFAIRLSIRQVGSAGSDSGNLYALSTVGSIIGAFLPVLVLIPDWGVRRTLFAGCVALLAVSLWGLRLPERVAATLPGLILLGPLLLPQIFPLGPLKYEPGLIYEQESLYNYIQVVQQPDGTRELILNEGQAIHSIYNPHQVLTGWYWDYFLAAPYLHRAPNVGQVKRIAIIGLAGGTVARQYSIIYPKAQIDGVEIDPAIVSVGRRYFGMNEPQLHVSVADGRTFIRTTTHTYDVVAIDAFQQPYIPFQLTTKEFFQEIRAHLAPDGVVCLNTGHTATDYRLVQAFVNTMATVFPSVFTFNVPDTFNTEVMATMRPTSLATLGTNMAQVPPGSLLAQVAQEVLPVAQVGRPQKGGIVFTDDEAPVEQLTDQLLIDYIQSH